MKGAIGSAVAIRGRTVHGSLNFEKHKIPVAIVSGKRPGSVLTVIGMQHATEYSGPAAMDRVLSLLSPTDLAGTLVCLPFVNPLQLRLTETEFRKTWQNPAGNLNRQWPGDARSKNPLSRLAAKIWNEVILRADAVIDYHCCRTIDPRFAACLKGDRGSLALAASMGLDAVDLQTTSSYAQGLLFIAVTEQRGIPAVLVEKGMPIAGVKPVDFHHVTLTTRDTKSYAPTNPEAPTQRSTP